MRKDITPRLPSGIAVEPVPDRLQRAYQRAGDQHALHPVLIDAEQIEELRQIGRVPFALEISLGDADVAALQQSRGKSVTADFHRGRRSRPVAAESDGA